MSFDGLYNIKLNNANPNANSCAFRDDDPNGNVGLIKFDDSDSRQKWIIRSADGQPDYYTIQSGMGRVYVVPQDDHLAYSGQPFVWIINSGRISTPGAPKFNWIPSDNGEFVIISPNSTWTISSA